MPEPLSGQAATPDELDWIALWREMRRTSPAVLDDAAKQMATISAAIATLYVSLLTALRTTESFQMLTKCEKVIFLAPGGVWVAAMLAAIVALLPLPYSAYPDSADSIQDACRRMNLFKFKFLVVSCIFLVIGVVIAGYGALFVLD